MLQWCYIDAEDREERTNDGHPTTYRHQYTSDLNGGILLYKNYMSVLGFRESDDRNSRSE